jgi:antitoxin (DNA-binding transcriptional repressor) of toxin-antitoxin stability system
LESSGRRTGFAITTTVNIGEAKTRLSELIAKVEAGEEFIIARGDVPVSRLSRIRRDNDVRAAIADIFAACAGQKATHPEELLRWRDEGRRIGVLSDS